MSGTSDTGTRDEFWDEHSAPRVDTDTLFDWDDPETREALNPVVGVDSLISEDGCLPLDDFLRCDSFDLLRSFSGLMVDSETDMDIERGDEGADAELTEECTNNASPAVGVPVPDAPNHVRSTPLTPVTPRPSLDNAATSNTAVMVDFKTPSPQSTPVVSTRTPVKIDGDSVAFDTPSSTSVQRRESVLRKKVKDLK
mmetsp:Transcript_13842/g.19205  ORF Transcript_13842/g.19205 Transcript_13842/m.19205 type:complete len:197 (+) Transcript_13842:136-726(+)